MAAARVSVAAAVVAAWTLAAAAACNEPDRPGAGAGAEAPADADAAAPVVPIDGPEEVPGPGAADPAAATDPGEPPDVLTFDRAVEQLGAIPAWRGVLDRARLLARRGDRGVLFGRIGGPVPPAAADPDAPPSGLVWLVDETQGDGALAVRVRPPGGAPAEGARVAVRGAWTLDEARRWVWQAEAIVPLPGDAVAPPPLAPGLVVHAVPPPGGAAAVRPPDTVAAGELLQFTVAAPPVRPGDGWAITDRRGGKPVGLLVLPGEADIFGGHDLRAADEQWSLERGRTYWVMIARVRRRDGQPTIFEAAAPPARFP